MDEVYNPNWLEFDSLNNSADKFERYEKMIIKY